MVSSEGITGQTDMYVEQYVWWWWWWWGMWLVTTTLLQDRCRTFPQVHIKQSEKVKERKLSPTMVMMQFFILRLL